jgi:hypothetical protein
LKTPKSPLSRIRDWNKKRTHKGEEQAEEKKLVPEPESPQEPAEEETEELFSESPDEEPEEPTAEPPTEEPEELPQEPPVQEGEEPVAEDMVVEELTESVPEGPSEEAEEPELVPEVAAEETEEIAPEPFVQSKERKPPKLLNLGFGGLFKRGGKEKKEKKEKESTPELPFLKLLVFPITLASMLLGLSIMPLFPQPLPAILAFLIAFLTYKKPIIGMPIGGLTIGLGLMYNLSQMNFISMLGSYESRVAFVFVLLFLFTGLPIVFRSRRAVVSINLGIIAAILLFFSQTYFLAIPLIFTAIVLFKRVSFLTVVYYGLISVPLEIMQYLNVVLPIERWDWWIEPGTSPPIFVPLTQIFQNVQDSMLQFRLYDTSKVVYAISDQLTSTPPDLPHTVQEMISHYFDSMPGIIMFLFMVIGIVVALLFFSRTFLAKSNFTYGERLIPTMSATVGVALFFILAAGLQGALAFRVDVNGAQMAIATFATLIFTLPTLMMDYTPKKRASFDMITKKADEIRSKLQLFEDDMFEVKNRVPFFFGPYEVKLLMIRDKLNRVLDKTTARTEPADVDAIFNELDGLSRDIDNLSAELDVALSEFQIFINCEYSKWVGQFKDMGLEFNSAKVDFQHDLPLKMRVDSINEVLDGSRVFINDVLQVTQQVYDIIRSLYDPSLPEENQSIIFAKQKIDEKADPWIALEALYNALNNWRKLYSVEIAMSAEHLKKSLTIIADLSAKSEKLLPILGAEFPKLMENAKKAEEIKAAMEKNTLNIINVIIISDVLQSSLGIAKDVLSYLYDELKSKEKTIEGLLPTEDYLWEKNDALSKQMTVAMDMLSNPSKYGLSQVLENMPRSLSKIEECADTIAFYNEKIELFLNYPVAEVAIEDLFKQQNSITAQNLPFEPKHAEEFLRLFHSKRYQNFSFDTANRELIKKT